MLMPNYEFKMLFKRVAMELHNYWGDKNMKLVEQNCFNCCVGCSKRHGLVVKWWPVAEATVSCKRERYIYVEWHDIYRTRH